MTWTSSPYSRGSFHVEWGSNGSHKYRLGCFSVSEDRELTLAGLHRVFYPDQPLVIFLSC